MPNRLASATSPYLRQHADNPVAWWEWEDGAFEAAAARDVPVILSVGYATCHWCHVMAHESFEDEKTAAFMNEHFVSIKVDREERPDVDRVYMDAVTAMTGHGGWPMTVFLTPDRRPIHAGTYYPKVASAHHPSFMQILEAVAQAWAHNRGGVDDQADHITKLISSRRSTDPRVPNLTDIEQAINGVYAVFDWEGGGIGRAPKFPQAPTLELLMRMAALRPHTRAGERSLLMLTTMLGAMDIGGIHDHLLGGFARYSVDATWTIPHFEKMLYDNALLARVYLRTWQLTGNERFKEVAVDVLTYLDTTLADEGGAIHSGEDADSEGHEGKFAVWGWDEFNDVLGDDTPLAAAIYGVTESGNFEGSNNLTRRTTLGDIGTTFDMSADEVAAAKTRIDDRLREVRLRRVPPSRDDKIVAAWNGLAVRAFAEAAAVLDERRWLDRAISIATFLTTVASPDGRLRRSWRDTPGHPAFAEDHGAVAVGLYSLYQVTGDERWFNEAERHVSELRGAFADPEGGWFATRGDASDLPTRPKNTQDNPAPSDNSIAAEALLIHAALTGDLAAVDEVERAVAALGTDALRHPAFFGHALAVWLTHLAGTKEVAITGPDSGDLTDVIWDRFRPDAVVALGREAASSVPLLEGRWMDEPTAYVCQNLVCDLPVHTRESLRDLLAGTG